MTRALQSTPLQNPGGSSERYGGRTNKQTEILVSNIGLRLCPIKLKLSLEVPCRMSLHKRTSSILKPLFYNTYCDYLYVFSLMFPLKQILVFLNLQKLYFIWVECLTHVILLISCILSIIFRGKCIPLLEVSN